MKPFDKILLATDFSSGAEAALTEALALRRSCGGSLTLLHVFELPLAYGELASMPAHLLDDLEQRSLAQMHALVAFARKTAEPTEAASISGFVVRGDPMRAIVDYARDGRFDLIVVGTHGRSGLARFLVGSVAERVVRTAECAVLSVRARS